MTDASRAHVLKRAEQGATPDCLVCFSFMIRPHGQQYFLFNQQTFPHITETFVSEFGGCLLLPVLV